MTFWERMKNRLHLRAYPPNWLVRLFDGWADSQSGISVTAESALTCTAFYSCVDLISRAIGHLPLHVYYRRADRKEMATWHRCYDLLHTRPNPEQTAFAWRQAMVSWLLRWGNAYADIQRDGAGRPAALWPLPADKMSVGREDGALVYIENKGGPNQKIYGAENVLHVKALGDGLVGKSPVSLFRETIGLSLGAEQAGASFFGKGMRPSGVVEHPNRLKDQALVHLRESIAAQQAGGANTGKPLILEEGMTWKPLSIPPEDAQYLETRTFQVRDIARIFHVPPHKLADLADATFANVEEQNIEWVTDGLAPWFVAFEQEFDYKLFLTGERPQFYTKFSAGGLLRGNAAARSDYYQKMFLNGFYSINEVRELEDMNPIGAEGNAHFVPVNIQNAEIALTAKPQAAPTPAPPPPSEPDDEDEDEAEQDEERSVAHDALIEATAARVRRMFDGIKEKRAVTEADRERARDMLRPAVRAWGSMLKLTEAGVDWEMEQICRSCEVETPEPVGTTT